jgi:competence protein ComEC
VFRWAPYTFVRVLFFLLAGIMVGIHWPDYIPISIAWIIVTVIGVSYVICFILWHFVFFYRFNPGFIGLAGIFLTGYLLVINHTQNRKPDHLSNVADSISIYKVVLTSYTEEKKNSWKVEGYVSSVRTREWHSYSGKIMLYFSKADFPKPFAYGDELLINGSPRAVQPPANPGEFDYQKYLGYRNIYHQHFLRKGDVYFIRNEPPSRIINLSIQGRIWADEQMKRVVSGEREQGIASALVLGITDGLDHETLSAYSATGAMHVLAVSGLHISIIYLLILWMCKPILKYKSGPWILAIVSLIILWGYAFITGLSPSVLRAVTMFSFVAIAKPTRQFTNIYNILAVSAYFLLVYDPFLIMSVGFQLSYIAVLGIVYLQPGLNQLWTPKNYLLNETWTVTTVSIAAQIATLPLGLYYFHQFPNYFLITNLLVIPASFVVLIAGIAVIAFGLVPILSSVLGWILTWSIKILNVVVFTVEDFPYAIIDNIQIDVFQCWILIFMIISLTLLAERKQFKWMLYAGACTILFSADQWRYYQSEVNQSKIVVYKVPNHFAMDLIANGQSLFYCDSVLMEDQSKIKFHIRPGRLIAGVKSVVQASDAVTKKFTCGELVYWKANIFMHLSKKGFTQKVPSKIDYLLISNNAVVDLSKLSFHSRPPKIILDGTNSYFYSERVLLQAKKIGLEIHSVHHHGAYSKIFSKRI